MKLLHIPAKSMLEIKIPAEELKKAKLPKRIGLVTTIQHLHALDDVKKQIDKSRFIAVIGGQILGCNAKTAEKIAGKVDAFLFIGTGEFHPLNVALKTGKKIFIFNPVENKIRELDEKSVAGFKQQRKGAMLKFLSAQNIGIIVSTKQGQERMKQAEELKKKLENKSGNSKQAEPKKCYLFACETLDFNQLENFNFIDCWVNTACPRIADNRSDIVNLDEL